MNDVSKIRPKRDWIIVLSDPRRDKTSSGLLLPTSETGVEKVSEGTGLVISVGPGKKNEGLFLKVGDKVLFRSFIKYANIIPTEEVWDDGQKKVYSFMSSDDIMAVVEPGVDVGVFSGRPENPVKE